MRTKTKFTTGDDNHVGDDYFLTSGDKIRYFLEEEAVDKNGKLLREKHRAVNKIGHGAHLCWPSVLRYANDRHVVSRAS